MALDPRLILSGVQKGIENARPFSNLMAGAEQAQRFTGEQQRQSLLGQQAQQQAALAPLQQQALEQKLQAGQMGLDAATAQAEQDVFSATMQQLGSAVKTLKPFIEKGDLIGAAAQIDTLQSLGIAPEALADIDQLIATGDLDDINRQMATVENLNKANMGEGEIIKSSQRLVNIDGKQFSEVDVAQPDGTLTTISTPVGGLVARKSTGLTAEDQAKLDVKTAGATQDAKTRAKLMAEFDLKPSVQAAVEKAVQTVKTESALKKEKRSDDKAFAIYESALSGLFDSLQGTITGPVLGFLPALSANQQIADGAVAAMGPVLKGVFRSAGEGTFTDKDQELLQAMLPDRNTAPEARAAQIATVDAIVRSKMGQPVSVMSSVLDRDVSMKEVFQEAVENNMTFDEVKRELGIK